MTDRAQDTEAIRAARETLPRDLREWASSLDLAADRDRLPRGTAASLLREAATTADRLVARLEAAERERDDLGPLFIRDACRILGVDEHDVYRMDALADRLAALAAAAPGETTTICAACKVGHHGCCARKGCACSHGRAAPGETEQTP